MGAAVRLREDFSTAELRLLAKRAEDPNQTRRLLALAALRDGSSRKAAAEIGAMDRQTLRDWVHRYNAEGLAGLRNRVGETGRDCRGFRVLPVMREREDLPHGSKEGAAHRG